MKMTIPAAHDVTTFALDAQEQYDTLEPLFNDALEPRRSLNSVQVSQLVHTLVAGFKALGLHMGDCVLVHTSNNVWFLSLAIAP
jgi:non-ribosomal peptide synthetase component E (peptide arylation enzyme)